ncbi:hypothetical protein BDV32DRAFT_155514 [Aspergillus pseudonomiae]|uniref:Uncharacterized protein n=1 Tax=Aspergillus pseudonomiae TaxID=1506151 RepID=A0A5N7CT53_9EURO|nr:uncharacterized protein BDV37DRAFT_289470 [Aspergillus pseudonomiae]KAB8254119.1 hypothetical protein BDV32DRAFT_155514 [Aspergillus pseudonomiae]KAE8397381.1 hypothetical protein BDV37DRAFT_289470 [Aspergillus pseudonomiae]
MTTKQEKDQERRRTKNSRERLKRRKERTVQGLHDYGLLSGARVYMFIQDRDGRVTEYRNTLDKRFPPSFTQIRRLFPSAKLLTPASFGASQPGVEESSATESQTMSYGLLNFPTGPFPFDQSNDPLGVPSQLEEIPTLPVDIQFCSNTTGPCLSQDVLDGATEART